MPTDVLALAWLPDERIQAVLEKAGSSLEEDGWQPRLEEIRMSGVAVSYGEVVRGVTAVGSAVRRADGLPIATVVVVAPEGARPERHAGKIVRAAAVLSDLVRVPVPSWHVAAAGSAFADFDAGMPPQHSGDGQSARDDGGQDRLQLD